MFRTFTKIDWFALMVCFVAISLFSFPRVSVFLSSISASVEHMSALSSVAAEMHGSKEKIPVRVMIVPGHDDMHSGATYHDLVEAELTVIVGEKVAALLENEQGVEVFLTRDVSGYNPALTFFLEQNKEMISAFIIEKKNDIARRVHAGTFTKVTNVHRNTARPEVVELLYGMNAFATDTHVDMAVHIHFNDYPRNKRGPGMYTGFSIYVPESQLSNARESKEVAQYIYDRLQTILPVSTNENESGGIIEDQELIALGAYDTLPIPSVLIEYGYIYESQFQDEHNPIFDQIAQETYRGIIEYIQQKHIESSS